jgi:hypothetical protein
MRRGCVALIGAVALLANGPLAATSRADGLPATGVDVGASGVAEQSGVFRYVTLPVGGDTIVIRTAERGGQAMFWRRIGGRFTIPAVAYDRSAGGLSTDGQTLVLIRPRARFPQRRTVLAFVDTPRLRARTVRLRGDFSFDAISPDGHWAYLIHYLSPRDPTRYEVRAYDLERRRLLAAPVVDPSEPGEAMGGSPLTREASPDGRWAYTLYDGRGKPFVHALDMVARRAVCVDLPRDIGRRVLASAAQALRLSYGADPDRLTLTSGGTPIAQIDTRTFRVSEPATPRPPQTGDGNSELFGGLLALALVTACVLWLGLRHTRTRRSGSSGETVATGGAE